jgi:arabinose-5-phosphate isomerase
MGMTAIVDAERQAAGRVHRRRPAPPDRKGAGLQQGHHPRRDARQPARTVHPEQLAVDAVAIMEEFRINQMLVVDADGKLVGALHIHDLTRAKVI